MRALDMIAGVIEREPPADAAVPLGIHLEGPFLSLAKRGVHTAALLVQPSISLFDRFWQAARGHIRIMTIAPELPTALELIEHASRLGRGVQPGSQQRARLVEAEAGFRAGARSATHTFNAMRSLDHRDPGIAAYVLDNDALFAEIICDGIHVDPAMVRLFFKAKGAEKAILITDGMSATGMPDGRYKLGDLDVEVAHGRCTSAGSPGVLAGSVLTMDQAVRNFSVFTGASLAVSAQLAGSNPAALMGLDQHWGLLEEGREANLVALSPDGRILQSFRAGRPLLCQLKAEAVSAFPSQRVRDLAGQAQGIKRFEQNGGDGQVRKRAILNGLHLCRQQTQWGCGWWRALSGAWPAWRVRPSPASSRRAGWRPVDAA